ncbi:MAG: hypothetical protein IPL42_06620 [Saprospiraceae bacterium]|nr:hypothetical protein [Saprospiraceae bacterium]
MKTINFVYILAILCIVLILPFIKKSISNSDAFFGIAENQVRSINLGFPVEIIEIFKRQGDAIKTGDTIARFKRIEIDKEKQNLEFDLVELEKKNIVNRELQKSELTLLLNHRNEINKNYHLKSKELIRNSNLQKDLLIQVYGDSSKTISNSSVAHLRDELNIKLQLELSEIDLKIKNLNKDIQLNNDALVAKTLKIKSEIKILSNIELNSFLLSPENGIIGQFEFNPGDKIPSYNSILKIYATHPNIVNTFIGEGFISTIQNGDTVLISSLINTNYILEGIVVNLGTRITALPERLKKIPELRAWGREVQINIQQDNLFLQGEKVRVQLLNH